jgi:hypothetical protein
MVLLAPPLHETAWEKVFLPLDKADIVGLNSMEKIRPSEGRKKLTWIWTVQGVDITDDKKTQKGWFILSPLVVTSY